MLFRSSQDFRLFNTGIKKFVNFYNYNILKPIHTIGKGDFMEKFILGAALGMVGGALMVANNCKLRNLVKKNQEDFMQKAEQYIDSKLEKMEGNNN